MCDRVKYVPVFLVISGILAFDIAYSQDSGMEQSPQEMAMPHAEGMHGEEEIVFDLPETRKGSGTSWMPDETMMYGILHQYGDWQLMLDGNIFIQSIQENTPRVGDQEGSINWLMAMGHTKTGGGNLTLRLMLSAEPWTVGKCGYPDLLQTGETCHGQPLHDRQHPHDLFMEVAASYERPLSPNIGLELYGGPVGEPALGPVAFPHRPSAFPGPLGPITHHWLDSTHISFGVLTAGLFTTQWKAEVSAFNGREPDENRTDLDLDPLDSYSGRISYLPTPRWALQISGGHLTEAENGEAETRIDVDRYTASIMYHQRLPENGIWATTMAYGENQEEGQRSPARLLESSFNIRNRHIVSGRVEMVDKTGHDLVLDGSEAEDRIFSLSKISAGYLYQCPPFEDWVPGLGLTVTQSLLPSDLKDAYGERYPKEVAVFVSLRTVPMEMAEGMHSMGHMSHDFNK
jgi:hypothetical protein